MSITIIAVNQTITDIELVQLALTIPGSGQVNLTDFNKVYEVQSDTQLLQLVTDGYVLINDGITTLDTTKSLNFLTPFLATNNLNEVPSITKEPTGFPNRTDSIISRNDLTRTFTIAPASSSFDIWYQANKITYTTPQSVTWSDINGTWFFYFNSLGVLVSTQDSSLWEEALLGGGVLVAALYWDATNNISIILSEERHGFMPADVHLELHQALGTQWVSGGALTGILADKNGSLDGYAQFAVSDIKYDDEDIRFDITNGSPQVLSPIAQIPIYYRSGTDGYWRKINADSFPVVYSGKGGYTGASGRLAYNQNTGSTWQLTEIGENNYVLSHIYGCNDIDDPIICLLGIQKYTTLSDAQAGARQEIIDNVAFADSLSKELTPLGSVIFQSSSTYINTPKATIKSISTGATYSDYRGTRLRGVVFGVTNHGLLTGLSDDDHSQYLLANGSRPMSGSLNMDGYNISNVKSINNWYDYGSLNADPVSPTPSDGYRYYNNVLTEEMFYDGTKAKWLGSTIPVYAGASGNTTAGTFFRGMDSLAFATNRGIPVVKGTLTGLLVSMTTSVTSDIEVLIDTTVIATLNVTTSGLTSNLTFNVDFNQGLMKFRNKSTGATVQNVQITAIYKRRA